MGEMQALRAVGPVLPAPDTTGYLCIKLARQSGLETGTRDDGAQNDFRGHNSAHHDLPTAKNQLGFLKAAARQRPV